jgi:hypothetical protein
MCFANVMQLKSIGKSLNKIKRKSEIKATVIENENLRKLFER